MVLVNQCALYRCCTAPRQIQILDVTTDVVGVAVNGQLPAGLWIIASAISFSTGCDSTRKRSLLKSK